MRLIKKKSPLFPNTFVSHLVFRVHGCRSWSNLLSSQWIRSVVSYILLSDKLGICYKRLLLVLFRMVENFPIRSSKWLTQIFLMFRLTPWIARAGLGCLSSTVLQVSMVKRKRRRSDSVLWQKPLYQQTIRKPKDNTKRHQKLQLHNDCGPT